MSFSVKPDSGTQVTFHVRYDGPGVPSDLHIVLLDPKEPSIDRATRLIDLAKIPGEFNPKKGFDIPYSTNPPIFPLDHGKLANGIYTFALIWTFGVGTRREETDPEQPHILQPPLRVYDPVGNGSPAEGCALQKLEGKEHKRKDTESRDGFKLHYEFTAEVIGESTLKLKAEAGATIEGLLNLPVGGAFHDRNYNVKLDTTREVRCRQDGCKPTADNNGSASDQDGALTVFVTADPIIDGDIIKIPVTFDLTLSNDMVTKQTVPVVGGAEVSVTVPVLRHLKWEAAPYEWKCKKVPPEAH